MAETLNLASTTVMDMETLRSRLNEIRESRLDLFDSSETLDYDPRKLIEELTLDFQGRVKLIELEESNVAALESEYLDAFLEQLRKEIGSTEEENLKISNEIDDLIRTFSEDLNLLDSDIELLALPPNLINFQGPNVGLCSGDAHESSMDISEDDKFEDLKLQQQIENCNSNLSTLEDLDLVFKRVETMGQFDDELSGVKVLEFEGNCMRLSLRTPIHSLDGLLFRHRLDCAVEPYVVEHELLIEFVDMTLELHKVKIYPNDVVVDDVIHTVKSLSHLAIVSRGSKLEYLVRQVQYRILLCTLKRLVLNDAKKSRHSIGYSERDETITAHLIGGIDAFIKIPQNWPIADSGLKLLSIKSYSNNSKSISPNCLNKIKEHANSLNIQTRGHLVRFMDAIEEILVQEMHSEH